jgi:hypothetical protein
LQDKPSRNIKKLLMKANNISTSAASYVHKQDNIVLGACRRQYFLYGDTALSIPHGPPGSVPFHVVIETYTTIGMLAKVFEKMLRC